MCIYFNLYQSLLWKKHFTLKHPIRILRLIQRRPAGLMLTIACWIFSIFGTHLIKARAKVPFWVFAGPNLTDKPLSPLSLSFVSWTSAISLTFSILYDKLILLLYLPSSQRGSLGHDVVVECCADKVTALLAHAQSCCHVIVWQHLTWPELQLLRGRFCWIPLFFITTTN